MICYISVYILNSQIEGEKLVISYSLQPDGPRANIQYL